MSHIVSSRAEKKMALLQVHCGVLLLGGTAQFSKLIPLSGAAISFGRAAIAAFVLVMLVKMIEGNLKLNNSRDYRNSIILGVLMALHWVTYFFAGNISGDSHSQNWPGIFAGRPIGFEYNTGRFRAAKIAVEKMISKDKIFLPS